MVRAFHLRPVVERMAEHLKSSGKLFMDETLVPVLDPGGKTRAGYLWALARDDRGRDGPDPPGVIFTYAPGRSGEHAEDILSGFDGTLQVDDYGGYNQLTKKERNGGRPVVLAYCWAHRPAQAVRSCWQFADRPAGSHADRQTLRDRGRDTRQTGERTAGRAPEPLHTHCYGFRHVTG